ncbi:MAG TPA: ABC transporter permease [Gemmatimonadales bacterium]|nr:ABC transporter permease [Gemmatimonadales bacterium]
MRKVWAVIRREFVERVRTRGFWIATLLGPVFFAAVILLPALLTRAGGPKRIAVVDGTSTGLGLQVAQALDATRAFDAVRTPGGSGVIDSLTAEVGAKRLDGFLLLDDAVTETGAAEYRASNVSALEALSELRAVLRQTVTAARLEREGVNPAVVARAQIRIDLDTKKISGTRTTGETAGQSFALAYFMAMLLYMAIVLYGVSVMNSVLEEKTNRVIEVLVSSLRPIQLMVGKLAGVGAVSLCQFLIWGLSVKLLMSERGALMQRLGEGEALSLFQLPAVPTSTVVLFLLYFLGGFALYSAMYAAVGAMSSTTQEAQQAAQPITIMLVVGLISMFGMLNDPGSTYAVVLSLIPFTAPIAVPVRWAAGTLPPAEVAASLALLALGIAGIVWAAARIYRVGILMTGKRPSLREVVRWVSVG